MFDILAEPAPWTLYYFLAQNCEVMVNDLLFSLEALETRAVKGTITQLELRSFCF